MFSRQRSRQSVREASVRRSQARMLPGLADNSALSQRRHYLLNLSLYGHQWCKLQRLWGKKRRKQAGGELKGREKKERKHDYSMMTQMEQKKF